MAKYRIEHQYPCYPSGSCIPYDGYFVQVLKEGFFTNKWINIKGFTDKESAENLLNLLKG
jgi:hypothetical protein